jgi:phosphohistidine phosphatase
MELILWRHADAEPGEDDFERALTTKGKKQADKMGKWLDRHLPQNCKVICSPARRAVQTAEALGRKYSLNAALGKDATAEDIIAEVKQFNGKRSVLVVGHQPTLGQVASLVIADIKQDWTIRKSNVLWIAQKEDDAEKAYLRVIMAPDFITE